MTQSFQARLPLARSGLDRDAVGRDRPGVLDDAWLDPATRVLVLHGRRALQGGGGAAAGLALLPPADLPDDAMRLYLGRDERGAVLAVLVDDGVADRLGAGRAWAELRTAGADLDAFDAGLFTEALALANWHAVAAYSPRTGQRTVVSRGGWVRHPDGETEESGGTHVFPRTDPAVIMGVVDPRDRLLLANNVAWEPDRYSVLAGFVEPGESLEAAVEREVMEEVGVRVTDVGYLGSQPWPFPASIMLGFRAALDPSGPAEPRVDGVEIRTARWFTRAELLSSLPEVRLPGRTSIARAIIEDWYGDVLPGDW